MNGYVLWTKLGSGGAAVWRVNPQSGEKLSGTVLSVIPPVLWIATGIASVDETRADVLWTHPEQGNASVWRINPHSGERLDGQPLSPIPGAPWEARGLALPPRVSQDSIHAPDDAPGPAGSLVTLDGQSLTVNVAESAELNYGVGDFTVLLQIREFSTQGGVVQPHSVAAVRSGEQMLLSWDGQLLTQDTIGSWAVNTLTFTLTLSDPAAGASIDERELFDRALSPEELAEAADFFTIPVATKYYFLNGQRVAKAVDGEVIWIHSDHLHSATILTDAEGNEVRRLAYRAFGEEAENTGSGEAPQYSYTGKERDSSGLMYYGARYYDPELSRFITADTVYDEGGQGLNRYSYVLNNPIKFIDPTGSFKEELEGEYGEIEKGDTLSEIAEQTDTTVEELMALNPEISDEDKIYAGDQLKVRKERFFRIVPRSAWGARPSIKSRLDPKHGYVNITLHHSGDGGSTSAYDMQGKQMAPPNNYGDIGYHWMIQRNGRILEGRDISRVVFLKIAFRMSQEPVA